MDRQDRDEDRQGTELMEMDDGPFMVGEYLADYGPLPSPEELVTPEVDALIARSRVLRAKTL